MISYSIFTETIRKPNNGYRFCYYLLASYMMNFKFVWRIVESFTFIFRDQSIIVDVGLIVISCWWWHILVTCTGSFSMHSQLQKLPVVIGQWVLNIQCLLLSCELKSILIRHIHSYCARSGEKLKGMNVSCC